MWFLLLLQDKNWKINARVKPAALHYVIQQVFHTIHSTFLILTPREFERGLAPPTTYGVLGALRLRSLSN